MEGLPGDFGLMLALLLMLREKAVRRGNRALDTREFGGLLPRHLFENARQILRWNTDEFGKLVDETCLRHLRRGRDGLEIALPNLVRLGDLFIDRLAHLRMLQHLRQ